MPAIAKYRQHSVCCCLSLKVGCKLLATLELFFPPAYVYATGEPIEQIPYTVMILFAVHYLVVLMLFWGAITRCCLNACSLILSIIVRAVLILAVTGWSIYMMIEGIDVLVHLGTLFFGLVFGSYTSLCTWSLYLEVTERPNEPRQLINVQITVTQ